MRKRIAKYVFTVRINQENKEINTLVKRNNLKALKCKSQDSVKKF